MADSTRGPIEIAGAGPAGLAAALAIARAGGEAVVLEQRRAVGGRFHGDFQGLENWTTQGDVLEELASLGIEPSFEHRAFRECVFFGPRGEEHLVRADRPLFYLVRRGPEHGTLDDSLRLQALAAGARLELERAAEHAPRGAVVAHGPRRADVIAVGYVFPTDRADGAYGVLSDELAPGGYAYLLIWGGRATLAACLFADFHEERTYLARTLEFFQAKVGIRLRSETRFGGFGNVRTPPRLRRGSLLLAGEAAGLQDTLFGFGMRYALVSGHLAGKAFRSGNLAEYEHACAGRLLPLGRAATVNRWLFERAGRGGRSAFVRSVAAAPDPRAWLRRYYGPSWWTSLAYPLARAAARRRRAREETAECREDCDCTYCRCTGDSEADPARAR